MTEVQYSIGGIVFQIFSDLPFPFYVANAEPFRCEASAESDVAFVFQQVNDIPPLLADAKLVADVGWAHVFRRPDGNCVTAYLWNEEKPFYIAVTEVHGHSGICYYCDAAVLADKARAGFELLNYMSLEQLLLSFDALVLHSSHVDVGGSALLFSAPSQTGKSTQAELWRIHAGARVINGDRSILRRVNGVWHAFGCPMCGTSGIHLQGQEPIGNLVMLAQAEENRVQRLTPAYAFRLIYPQVTVPSWEAQSAAHATDLLLDFISTVPVWRYACTKTPEAVTVLKQVLEQGEQQ